MSEDQKLLFKAILPDFLMVEVHKAEEGGYWAKVKEIHCYSQGETFSELFNVLTKSVYAYYNIPENLISELGHYFPVNSVREVFDEENPPKTEKYTLDDILQNSNLGSIRELQRVS